MWVKTRSLLEYIKYNGEVILMVRKQFAKLLVAGNGV